MIERKTLGNGVRVVVKQMEGLFSVTMGILVGTGSAFETDREDGISHFIEHVQFKGTDRHTAFGISDAFESLGAQVNAFTGKEITCYHVKSTTDHAEESFELLAEIFLRATFPEDELKREKGVILEEISMNEDTPEDLCYDNLARALFGKGNYGRNTLGPAKNVERFTREDIFAYKKARYCPQNIVISFAGNIEIPKAMELAERLFGELHGDFVERKKRIRLGTDRIVRKKPIEQTHFAIGLPTVRREDPALPAVQVMSFVLGGGLSSRLFKRVREELGLAYSVGSYTSHYAETGVLCVYAAVNRKNLDAALSAVLDTIGDLKRGGITEEEFLRGREQLKASNIFTQESTASQMLLYGKQMLLQNEIYDMEKKMRELSALTVDDVQRALEGLDLGRAAAAAVGEIDSELKL